jgi:hypothetical protein
MRVTHLEAHEVVPVVGALGQFVWRHLEVAAGNRIGRLTGGDPGQVDDQGATTRLDTVDVCRRGGAVQPDLGPGPDALRPVGQRFDAEAAAQPL